jgi:hypothetical protein
MLNNLSERMRACHRHAEDCARKAHVENDPTLKRDFLDMERRWLADADLLAIMQSRTKESTQLLASVSSEGAVLNNIDRVLLSKTRTLITESKHLLARLDERADSNPANLSIQVFKSVSGYGWTVRSPADEMLASGTAETKHKARIDAFRAGMIYVDHLKGRSAPKDFSSLH